LAWEAEIRNFKQKLKYQDACVCSIKVYKTTRSSNQTNTCVEKAARHYYNKIYPGRFLIDVEPLDSHTFDRHSEDPEDNNIYYHINFQAKLGTCNSQPSLFFAELQGKDEPERVNICTELNRSGDLENCDFCTGLTHPANNFVGCIHPSKWNK